MLSCSVKRKFHLDSVKNGLQWAKAGSEEPGMTEGPILSTGKADQHQSLISLGLSSWALTQRKLSTLPYQEPWGPPHNHWFHLGSLWLMCYRPGLRVEIHDTTPVSQSNGESHLQESQVSWECWASGTRCQHLVEHLPGMKQVTHFLQVPR